MLPSYPLLRQIVRTDVNIGAGVYAGFVQQQTGTTQRDRERCYVYEVNGLLLSPGKYKVRLIGSYAGPYGTHPLFGLSIACCTTSSSSSTSSSSLVTSSLATSSLTTSSLSLTPSSLTSSLSTRPSSSVSVIPSSVSPSIQSSFSSEIPRWYCMEPPWYCLTPPGG